MKTLFRILPLLLIIFFSNCATVKYDLAPVILKKNMKKFYNNDREILFCEGIKSNLLVYGFREKDEIYIYPYILNKTTNNFIDIIPDNFEIYGVNDKNETQKLYIYPAKEYIEKKKSEQAWAQFFVALSGAVNAMNAAKSTTYSSGYSHSTGTYGRYNYNANTYGSGTATTYDYSKSLEAQERTKQELNELQINNDIELQNLNNMLLKKNTLPPNYSIEGYVIAIADYSYNSKYVIILPVGNEKYRLLFLPKIIE